MIRVLGYLILIGILAFAAVWLADRPGDVVVTWQGWHLETSVMVAVATVLVIAAIAVLLWSLFRALLRSPRLIARAMRERRGARGYRAVSQGLIAVGSGDPRAARKFADEALRLAPQEPLTLLLSAQAAQLSGDREGAEQTFHAMASREETRLLGLHGLFIEAQRRNDVGAALALAEEAANSAQAPAWAGHAAFAFRCIIGDWSGALDRLDRNLKGGVVDRAAYRRQRAVLLTARALSAGPGEREAARDFALEAVRFEPTLVPAAALAGRLLGEGGDLRRAARIVEAAWKANPHPDLANTYAHLRPGDSARERLVRVQALAKLAPGHRESALAVARAAIEAQEFAVARDALAPLLAAPTQRTALLMAELEERQNGDEGRAREWMTRAVGARRDPAWVADGFVSERWLPVSPVTGRLDAFQWRDPVPEGAAALGNEAPLALGPAPTTPSEPEAETTAPEANSAPRATDAMARATALASSGEEPTAEVPHPEKVPVEAPIEATPEKAAAETKPSLEPLTPLVHAPDDPGPEPDAPLQPAPKPAEDAAPDGWRRLRNLFKSPTGASQSQE